MKTLLRVACLILGFVFDLGILHAEELYLRSNLKKAIPGDYIVTSASKNLTLMHIYDKSENLLTIEEISIPEKKGPKDWKTWIGQNAPGHTRWILYEINLQTGKRERSYSFTKGYWFEIPECDDLLSKILNLKLQKIPEQARKRIGPKPGSGPDLRHVWQPPVVVENKKLSGVHFDAWWTKWPRSEPKEFSGKRFEVYIPSDNQKYPSYFPYWLQISGTMGKAKIRIVNSGSGMHSPKPPLSALNGIESAEKLIYESNNPLSTEL